MTPWFSNTRAVVAMLVLIGISVTGFLLLSSIRHGPTSVASLATKHETPAAPASTSALAEALSKASNINRAVAEPSKRVSGSEIDVFEHVSKSRSGLPMEDDPFVAESAEEQAWLDRNGFPNAAQWHAYSQASDSVLSAAAQSGDRVAKDMADSRRLASGDQSAIEDLLVSAAKGSGFALELLAGYLQGSKSHGDPVAAYSLRRVQELRGNYRTAIGREILQSSNLSPFQRAIAEAEAVKTFDSLSRLQIELTGKTSPVDPRPIGSR